MSWRSSGAHQLDPELIYVNKPNYKWTNSTTEYSEEGKINSAGFRDEEIIEKKNGVKRIAMVGDSFVFGHGISENNKTISEVLENLLKNTEVINTGVRGYSPDQEYKFILKRVLSLSPDLVIWELNPHDIHNLVYFPSLYDLDKEGNLIPTDAKLTWIYWQGQIIGKLPGLYRQSSLMKYLLNSFSSIPYLNRALLIPEYKREKWVKTKLTKEVISASKYLKDNGVNVLISFFPVKNSYISVNNNDKFSQANIFEELKNDLKNNSVELVDIRESIWSNYKDNSNEALTLFFEQDYHFNDKGAELTAKILKQPVQQILFENRRL